MQEARNAGSADFLPSFVPAFLRRSRRRGRPHRKLDAPLGPSADLMADSLLLPPERKQRLLEELDPIARTESLLRFVEEELARATVLAGKRFPWQPSRN